MKIIIYALTSMTLLVSVPSYSMRAWRYQEKQLAFPDISEQQEKAEDAIKANDLSALKSLLTSEDGVNKYKLLHVALDKNREDIVYYLLDSGVDAKEQPGITNPLEMALEEGSISLLQALYKAGAHESNFGSSAMHLAVTNKRYDLIPFLVKDKYLDIDKKDSRQRTPLYWAAYQGDVKMMECLISYGAKAKIACEHSDITTMPNIAQMIKEAADKYDKYRAYRLAVYKLLLHKKLPKDIIKIIMHLK